MTNALAIIEIPFNEATRLTTELAERGCNICERPTTEQTDWLLGMGKLLAGWESVSDITQMTEAQILYTVHKVWEVGDGDGTKLDAGATVGWEGDFYRWAQAFTKRRASREPARVTIQNKMAVYRDWESDEKTIHPPPHVYIPKRDECGNLVDPKLAQEDAWVEIDFDPRQIDFSKKLHAAGAAKRGMMSEEAWTALADPCATVAELDSALRDGNDPKQTVKTNGLDFKFWEQNGILFAGTDGISVAFARLLGENGDSPIARRAAEYMLGLIGIKTSTAFTDAVEMQLPLVQKVENGVVISKGEERIGYFTFNEAAQIKDSLEEVLGV